MSISPRKRKRGIADEGNRQAADLMAEFVDRDRRESPEDPIEHRIAHQVLEWLMLNLDCAALVGSFSDGFTPRAVRDYFGHVLSEYQPLCALGMPGGSGAVFKCSHREDSGVVQVMKCVDAQKCVAADGSLKRAESEVTCAPEELAALYDERMQLLALCDGCMQLAAYKSLQAELQHPNIVRMSDFIVNVKTCILQMDFCLSVDLHEALFECAYFEGADKEQRAQSVTAQLVAALWFAHTRSPPILHRDVKPANVLLLDCGLIKLFDWGLARHVSQSRANWRPVAAKVLGTQGFRPPELESQVNEPHTDKVDAYGVGCTLGAMLTRSRPGQVKEERSENRLIVPHWLDHWAKNGVESVERGHSCRQLIDGLTALRAADRLDMAQAANHPWVQAALCDHCVAYQLEAHGMRIQASDGATEIRMIRAAPVDHDRSVAQVSLDALHLFKREVRHLPEDKQPILMLSRGPSLFRHRLRFLTGCSSHQSVPRPLESIRIYFPEAVKQGMIQMQLAQLYFQFMTHLDGGRALDCVESAIRSFDEYDREASNRSKLERAAEMVKIDGQKGMHSPAKQPLSRAHEIREAIVLALPQGSRRRSRSRTRDI